MHSKLLMILLNIFTLFACGFWMVSIFLNVCVCVCVCVFAFSFECRYKYAELQLHLVNNRKNRKSGTGIQHPYTRPILYALVLFIIRSAYGCWCCCYCSLAHCELMLSTFIRGSILVCLTTNVFMQCHTRFDPQKYFSLFRINRLLFLLC